MGDLLTEQQRGQDEDILGPLVRPADFNLTRSQNQRTRDWGTTLIVWTVKWRPSGG